MRAKFDTLVILAVSLLVFLLAGCGSTTYKNGTSAKPAPAPSTPAPSSPGSAQQNQSVNFATIQENILNPSCVRCHSGSFADAGISMTTFAELNSRNIITSGNAEGSLIFQVINNGRMPKGGPRLSQSQIDLMKTWINSGAPER